MIDENQKIHPIYPEPYRLASEIWENKIVQKNWREPLKLIKAMGWETIPYDYEEIINLSKEAYCTYRKRNFYILYNINNVQVRITFSLDHEIGHVVCGHPIRCGEVLYKSCENSKKRHIEVEASIAGRNIHFPAPVIQYLVANFGRENTIKYLQHAYYISEEYATNSLNVLAEDLKYMNFQYISFKEEIEKEKMNIRLFLITKNCHRFGGEYNLQKPFNPKNNNSNNNFEEIIMELLNEKRKSLGCF